MLPAVPLARNKHTEQTNVLEFYVKYFVIPPLLNGPQILSLESDQVKLRVDFLKKTLT